MIRDIAQATVRFDKFAMRLEVFADSDLRARLAEDGVWERHVTLFLARILPQIRAPLFFDVGANVGYYSVLAAKLGARVAAFEPNAAAAALLRRNVEANGCTDVTLDQRIVGDGSTPLRLVPTSRTTEESYTVPADAGQAEASTSVDAYCRATGAKPSFIKSDVEGRDLDVIAGALGTLSAVNSIALFEYQPARIEAVGGTSHDALFDELERIGYVPHLFRGHSGAMPEMVDYDILRRLYDLYASRRLKSYWDVLLWPPTAPPLSKPFVLAE